MGRAFKIGVESIRRERGAFRIGIGISLTLAFIGLSLMILAFICFSISIIFILLTMSKHNELEPVVVEPVVEIDDNDGWMKTELSFHHFAIADLRITGNEESISPEFSFFGHNWRVNVSRILGRTGKKNLVLLYLQNMSDKSIKIRFSLSIKHLKGKMRLVENHQQTFDPNRFGPSRPNMVRMELLDDSVTACLVDGTLRIEVKMKLDEPKRETNPLPRPPVVEDCPICMEPISKPWGAVIPCGHPFHQSCWDQVVARHSELQPSCVVCRKVSTGFQRVYLD